jgi:ABC-type sugar transport system substrate-binding protein
MRPKAIVSLLTGFALLFTATSAFAEGTQEQQTDSADDTYTIGALLKTTANPYWGAMEAGIQDAAEEMNIDLLLQSVQSEQATEEQLNTLQNMLTRDPDALVVAAINSVNLLPGLKRANEDDIPIADLDANLDPEKLQEENVEISFAISSNNRRAGAKAAQYVVDQLGDADGTPQVLVIEGIAGNVTSIARTEGFAEELNEIAPNYEIVGSLPGKWDRLEAANIAQDTVQANPGLDAIYAANDTMALGAVEQLYSSGDEGVFVVGTDGNAQAVESIQKGRLDATVAQLPYLVGFRAVENLVSILDGEDVEERIYVPTFVMDQEVLESGEEELLQYVQGYETE